PCADRKPTAALSICGPITTPPSRVRRGEATTWPRYPLASRSSLVRNSTCRALSNSPAQETPGFRVGTPITLTLFGLYDDAHFFIFYTPVPVVNEMETRLASMSCITLLDPTRKSLSFTPRTCGIGGTSPTSRRALAGLSWLGRVLT